MSDERILENIIKLKSLGMTDKEIIDNLVNIGLSKEESEKLVINSNNEDKNKSELQTKINTIKERKKENIKKEENKTEIQKDEIPDDFLKDNSEEIITNPLNDEIEDDLNEDNYKTNKKSEVNNYSSKELDKLKNIYKDKDENIDFEINLKENISEDDLYKKYDYTDEKQDIEYTPEIKNNYNDGNEEIWQKGLLTTINSKLNELENKQKNIEELLKTKINLEVEKISRYQENIKKEIINKNNSVTEKEIEKINTKVITEMTKLKIIQAKLNNKLQNIEDEKNKILEITKEYNELKQDIKNNIIETKKRTDHIILGTEENITKIITKINIKLNEKIKEINSTLSLQSKITEGLVKNTQNSIGTEIKRLNDFQKNLVAQIDPKRIYDKISELENFKIKLANRYEERFEKVKREFLQKAKIGIKSEIENELKELKDIRQEIANKTDPEKIDKKIQELKKLEEEMVVSIDNKIEQSLKIYQAATNKEFKDKMLEIDNYKQNLEKSKMLQITLEEKIKEIDRFKKQFIAVIDENIDKMNQNMQILMQQKK